MDLKLFEFAPTRSARCRWTLQEAGLDFKTEGNSPAVLQSDSKKRIL
jgi:hypothetical protein